MVFIRPRKGGDGLKYTMMPKLGQINSTIQEPLGHYNNAVMGLPDLFTVEPVK